MKKFQLLNAFKLVIVQSFQKFHGATQDHYLLRKSTFKSRVQLKKIKYASSKQSTFLQIIQIS